MRLNRRSCVTLAVCFAISFFAGCASTSRDGLWTQHETGRFHRAVTTTSPEAQQWFDQGLVLCFGFDQEVARLSFARAAAIDPKCAMAHWGYAYAYGPHINNPSMDEAASQKAHDSVMRAVELADKVSPVERDLIRALSKRYVLPAPADRRELDVAYANAMREVWRAHPDDDDVGALFAESMMNLRPWDLWTPEGIPRPETPEVVSALETVLARQPDHPGATHYYIHAMEASPNPENAVPASDRLRARVPGSSHLVHMPSHIDIRVGRYAEAVSANARAVKADQVRIDRYGAGGFYAMYRAHNYHFLMWAAMFDGQSAVAMNAARDIVKQLPDEVIVGMPQFVEAFIGSPYHVMVRFGQWEEILREPEPKADLYGTRAMWHYARALAFAAQFQVDNAVAESERLAAATKAVPASYMMGRNSVSAILEVAREMVAGEVAYRRGNLDVAFNHLREAVRLDDLMNYDEPWGWVQPARHALGALLLEQGLSTEAERVYRRDLERHPNNGWSLHGLAECLRRTGRTSDALHYENLFTKAWARADITLRASCFCRTSAQSE